MAPTYVEFAVPLKRDGAGSLFGVAYEPSTSPRGVLVFHHGYAEHVGRYQTGERPFCHSSYEICRAHHCVAHPLPTTALPTELSGRPPQWGRR
jgi:hypothetical protein